MTNGSTDLTRQTDAGVLKAYMNGCKAKEFKKINNKPMSNIFKKDYICRVFIYRAQNLVPLDKWIGKPLDPYIVVRNGTGDLVHLISTREDAAPEDPFNPGWYRCLELDTRLPDNNELEILVWSKSITGDELIGSTKIDLERRMLNEDWFGWNRKHQVPKELRDLHNVSSCVSQGKLEVRVELVDRAWSKTHPPENIAPPPPAEYELRLVVWNTEKIRNGDVKKRGESVHQTLQVITQFDGENEDKRYTDIAWSMDGDADWNWRYVYPVKLPCKVPRVKFSIWEAAVISEDQFIGEAHFNLAKFFKATVEDKKMKALMPRETAKFIHSNFISEKLGCVNFEAQLVIKDDALNDPVGEAQNEPNKNPYLPPPKRNPAPYQVNGCSP